MKFNVVVATQIHENYGAHDWDGKGQCPQYWKAKGGEEYRHPVALDLNEVQDRSKVNLLVEELTKAVSCNDDSFQESVLDWYFLPVGEFTSSEKFQLELYGQIVYPSSTPQSLKSLYAV